MDAILDAIVTRTPPPEGDPAAPPRALIFDSEYDQYRGVIAYVRVIDGGFSKRQLVRLMRTDQDAEIEELGYFGPEMKATDRLETGEVGYIITGVKDVAQVRVGDTITDKKRPAGEALPGYKVVQPMVFTGLFPTEGDKFEELRDALEKLKLNDAALTYEPESSRRPRLRLPLRLPRPPAHGHRARAPRARVRPRAHHHDAERRVPRATSPTAR